MSFLVDTNICSAFLRGDRRVHQRMLQHAGQLHVSVLTAGELYTWASRKKAPKNRLPSLARFFTDIILLDVTHDVARKFGELRASLLDQRGDR